MPRKKKTAPPALAAVLSADKIDVPALEAALDATRAATDKLDPADTRAIRDAERAIATARGVLIAVNTARQFSRGAP